MEYIELLEIIDRNLADAKLITPAKHREVEQALALYIREVSEAIPSIPQAQYSTTNAAVALTNVDYPVKYADYVILVDTTSNSRLVTLPQVLDINKVFIIKKITSDGNKVTIDVEGGVGTVDGNLSYDILSGNEVVRVIYHSGNYYVI